MSYSDLLERMMERDSDAFLEMTDRYGWALYSEIRKVHPDKTEADAVYQETMQQFYRSLQNPNCSDPLEALLCAMSEHIAYRKGFLMVPSEEADWDPAEAPPAVKAQRLMAMQTEAPEKRRNWFGTIIAFLFVTLVLAFGAWIIAGFLMEQGILPFWDLGYSWFCSTVEQWLLSMNLI